MTIVSMLRRTTGAVTVLLGTACQTAVPPDYAAQHKPAVDAEVAAWNTGNVDGLDAVMSTSVRRVAAGFPTTETIADFKKTVTDFRTAYPDAKLVIDEIHSMDGVSVSRWTFTGTNTGPGTAPPTGKSVKVSGLTQVKYEGGKVVEEVVDFDTADWYTQLGFTMTPPKAKASK